MAGMHREVTQRLFINVVGEIHVQTLMLKLIQGGGGADSFCPATGIESSFQQVTLGLKFSFSPSSDASRGCLVALHSINQKPSPTVPL